MFLAVTGIFLVLLLQIIVFGKQADGLVFKSVNDRQQFLVIIALILSYFAFFIITKNRYYTGKKLGLIIFILLLSIISGLTFTLMTYLMNRVISANIEISAYLVGLFGCTLSVYAYSVKVVRKEITTITNTYMCDKRKKILENVSKCSFEKYENIGNEKIYICINNDIENISSLISIAVSGLTSSVVMLCCCMYLAFFNIKLFIIAFAVIIVVFILIVGISYLSQKKWNVARKRQEKFYGLLDGLLKGFADLVIKKKKLNQYMDDMHTLNQNYTESRIKAEVYFSYVAFATEALIFLFLGITIIVLPLLSKEFTLKDVSEFFVVFMMLKGHFDVVVNSVPQIPKMLASNSRIRELLKEFGTYKEDNAKKLPEKIYEKEIEQLEYKNVEFEYKNNEDYGFKIGPIDLTLKKGEITFVIGGNGSGKSTLGKVITGLYRPDKGMILVNAADAREYRISELFSTIYFDTYLFPKLYGIEEASILEKSDYILREMGLDNKIEIKDGVISDIRLSTGQKKRVALVISYLEDSPIYFFDEWAAEQDPEFKKFFYTQFLPMLKKSGKCVIAITHDDRYFDVADHIIKIDEGKIIVTQEG